MTDSQQPADDTLVPSSQESADSPGEERAAYDVPPVIFVASVPPPESVAREAAVRNHATFSLSKLLWLVTLVAVMLGIYNFVPQLAERISYSVTRGRERAEYELARERLAGKPLEGLS